MSAIESVTQPDHHCLTNIGLKQATSAVHKSKAPAPPNKLCFSLCSMTTPTLCHHRQQTRYLRPKIYKMHALKFIFASVLWFGASLSHECQNLTIPLDISVRNGVFNTVAPQTVIDVTNLALNAAMQGRNYS
jgi:hypothetical protein